ncbi:CDP-abequose synthase [Acrocarpospora phusangensis]|uniref:CDP-abequose synthase n=1 Tax=Acrocarpospora phusangensis TaxID=1070424 RepID=A0A919Q7Z6_9ACTN|nr:NAD-dependent epimerase/dehydratase family protein [Acrocarpospora phusangensis]GIH22350.1 CDP-abequose synthase [Acrocarpospora phusangensis]
MAPARVLVTGAAGFIGAHLTRRLRSLGTEVHAVARAPRTSAHGEVWHVCDLRDADAVGRLFAGSRPEVVVHLASDVNGARDPGVVLSTLECNLVTAVNVLLAAREGTRVIMCGSSEEPRRGNDFAPPPSPYAMAKAAAAGYALQFHRLWGLPVTILRPTMVYGPGQWDTGKLVPYLTLALLRGEEPRLTSGAKLVDWVYVDDVVEAFVAACRERPEGMEFDVGTGTARSVRETVELLFKVAGSTREPRFGTIPDRPLDLPQIADLSGADLLGWRPQVGLEEGLRRTFDWYAEQLRSGNGTFLNADNLP